MDVNELKQCKALLKAHGLKFRLIVFCNKVAIKVYYPSGWQIYHYYDELVIELNQELQLAL